MGKHIHKLSGVDLHAKIAICAECGPTKIYARIWNGKNIVRCVTARNREKYHYNRDRRIRLRRLTDQVKIDRGCEDCGFNSHPAALEFHHINGKKHEIVSRLVSYGSRAGILREMLKCTVLCANCHRIRTFGVTA